MMRALGIGLCCSLLAVAGACTVGDADENSLGADDEPDFHGEDTLPDDLGVLGAGVTTVGQYASTACSTAGVRALSLQVAQEINCMSPGTLTSFAPGGGITFTGSAVLPYLDTEAAVALRAVARRTGAVNVTSGFRTVVQQWLLSRWAQAGRCGIAVAATPGHSNHESARAVDLSNYASVVATMRANGWAHDVAGDPVHFDHLSSPDLRGMDVHAFQRLWNRNHPGDRIAEDGDFGPQTSARIAQAPLAGFAHGPTCR